MDDMEPHPTERWSELFAALMIGVLAGAVTYKVWGDAALVVAIVLAIVAVAAYVTGD